MSGRRADLAIAAVISAVLLVALSPAWERPESQFDEGFALAYGSRVLEGDVPHRDFVSFYGPGNPWIVAGAFAIAGTDQETERVVGALYRLLIALGAAALAGGAGRAAALAAGLATVPLFLRMGFPAYAAFGSLGFGLAGLALLLHARGSPPRMVAAGLAIGIAGLVRPEFLVPVLVAAVPLLLPLRNRRLVVAGAAPAALALAVHLVVVGGERLRRVVSDLDASGPGRELPFDLTDAWTPDSEDAARLLIAVVVLGAGAAAAALVARRRGQADQAWRGCLSLAVLALALVPYALSRLDYTHVVIALIPAVAAGPALAGMAGRRWAPWAAAVAVVATTVLAAPTSVDIPVRTHANQLLGRVPGSVWSKVELGGRTFLLDPAGAEAVQRIADAAERERRAGARTLFVGPRDLRRSNVNDAFLYYLLADLKPASYYLELNPWTANRPGSGLAGELRRADLLVLNSFWDEWDEPNESDRLGPDEPNRVVRERFCAVERAGTFELLRRCPTRSERGQRASGTAASGR